MGIAVGSSGEDIYGASSWDAAKLVTRIGAGTGTVRRWW